jgi:hypothetical protein
MAPLERNDRMDMSSGEIPLVVVNAKAAHCRCCMRVVVVIWCHCEPLW